MWDYAEDGQLVTQEAVYSKTCIYCGTTLLKLPSAEFHSAEPGSSHVLLAQPSFCTTCGWWSLFQVFQGYHPRTLDMECYSGSIGSLLEFDPTNISQPLSEVRKFIAAKRDAVYELSPRIFEEVVASVFRDLGWSCRVTAYSGDGGIDVIVDGPGGATAGVQVRRHKKTRKVEAEQIRSLAGALILNGHTCGAFVTTSSFRRGAKSAAHRFGAIGTPIELYDCERFLEALGIAQRKTWRLEPDVVRKRVLVEGVHIGSGKYVPHTEGEDLLDRKIIICIYLASEFIDTRGAPSEQRGR
jgi:restriction system protein